MLNTLFLIEKNTLENLGVAVQKALGSEVTYPMTINTIITDLLNNYNKYGSYTYYQTLYESYINRGLSGDIYLSVANIGDYAFYGCENITGFSLPYCTTIDQGAFYGCANLSKIYAPLCSEFMSAFSASLVANLTDVNLNLIVDNSHDKGFSSTSNSTYQPISFYAHPNITNITMNNVQKLGSSAFHNCPKLINAEFINVKSVNQSAFYKCDKLQNILLPITTFIGKQAFRECDDLKYLNLPELTSCNGGAFSKCTSLKLFKAPKFKTVGDKAFYGDAALESITIGMTAPGPNFQKLANLKYISMSQATAVTDNAFLKCTNLKTAYMPNITTIGQSAFAGCASLQNLDASKVTTIETLAFAGCTSLAGINTPEVKVIEAKTFQSCANLQWSNCDFRNVTTVKDFAFADCVDQSETPNPDIGLSQIDLPKCNKLGKNPFNGCTKVQYAYFGELTTVAADTLSGETHISRIDLPKCTIINAKAFFGCEDLTYISIPHCTKIGANAFAGCTNLSVIYLPKCANIGENAFAGCTSLEYVYLLNNDTATVNATAFTGCTNLDKIYVRNGLDYDDRFTAINETYTTDHLYIDEENNIAGQSCFASLFEVSARNIASLSFRDANVEGIGVNGLYLTTPFYSTVYTLAESNLTSTQFNTVSYYKFSDYVQASVFDRAKTYYTYSSSYSAYVGKVSEESFAKCTHFTFENGEYTLAQTYNPDSFYYILSYPFHEEATFDITEFLDSTYYIKSSKYIQASTYSANNEYYYYNDFDNIYGRVSNLTSQTFSMASYYISIDDYVPTSYYNANWQYYYGGSNYKKINGLTENAFNQSAYYLKSKNYTLASYANYQNGIPCYSSSLSVIYKNKNYYSVITEITTNNDSNIRSNYFKGPCYVWDLNLEKYIEKNHNKYLYYKGRGEGHEYIKITNFIEDLPQSLENYDYEIQEENDWY